MSAVSDARLYIKLDQTAAKLAHAISERDRYADPANPRGSGVLRKRVEGFERLLLRRISDVQKWENNLEEYQGITRRSQQEINARAQAAQLYREQQAESDAARRAAQQAPIEAARAAAVATEGLSLNTRRRAVQEATNAAEQAVQSVTQVGGSAEDIAQETARAVSSRVTDALILSEQTPDGGLVAQAAPVGRLKFKQAEVEPMAVLFTEEEAVVSGRPPGRLAPATALPTLQQSLFGDIVKGIGKVAGGFLTGGVVGAVKSGISVFKGGGAPPAPILPPPGVATGGFAGPITSPGLAPGIDMNLARILAGAIPGIPGAAAQALLGRNGQQAAPATVITPGGEVVIQERQLFMSPAQVMRQARPHPDYVLVTRVWAAGSPPQTLAVLKSYAKEKKWWSPRARPLISAKDAKILRRSAAIENKLVRVTRRAGFTVAKKGATRRTKKVCA